MLCFQKNLTSDYNYLGTLTIVSHKSKTGSNVSVRRTK